MGKREPLSEEWFEALDALHESERSRRWRLRMGKPEFTREGLERWAARRSDDAGRLFTFCLSLMDERDEAATIAEAYSPITKGGKAWLVSDYDMREMQRHKSERRKDVEALRQVKAAFYGAEHTKGIGQAILDMATYRVAAWDKENHDG